MLRAADFRRVATLIAFAFASSAYAQGANFSTLAWGDTVGTVQDKLKVDSYDGFDLWCKLEVLLGGHGVCRFENGRASYGGLARFEGRRLVEIELRLETAEEAKEAIEALSRKHGVPRVTSKRAEGEKPSLSASMHEYDAYYWQTRNGDSVLLIRRLLGPHDLTYTSAALNAERAKTQALKTPKF